MSRRGENIYKRKDGRWEGRYIKGHDITGKAIYGYVYAHSYSIVKERLKCKSSDALKTKVEKVAFFVDITDQWLQHKQIEVKESTYEKYKYLINSYIAPKIGQLTIQNVTADIIEKFVIELLNTGNATGYQGLSPKTVSDILSVTKGILNYAESQGYRLNGNYKNISVKQFDKEMRVLNNEEQVQLTAYLCQNTDLYMLGTLISLYTGIRVGELCAMRWEDIDLNKKIIYIRKTLQRIPSESGMKKTHVVITNPKSASSLRDIPIPDCLFSIIQGFENEPKTYVLTGDQEVYAEPRIMQYHFARYIKAIGIAPANYHSLRHTFATRCIETGFDVKTLSEILGHSNVSITLSRYVHSSFDRKKQNMSLLKLSLPSQ